MAERRDDKQLTVSDGIVQSMPVFAKELVAGGVAGGMAKTVVAPLELVKILFQTRKAEFQSVGLLGSFRKIVQTEGLLGFYKGNGAGVARIVPYAALHYMAYEQNRRWIILTFPDIRRSPVLDLVAGSIAGGTAVLFTYPLDLVRTRLAYQVAEQSKVNTIRQPYPERVYRGIVDCLSKIYKQSGIKGLYRGAAPSLYGIFPYSGLKFYFYEKMKSSVPQEHKKDITVNLISGSVAGLLSQTLTYPLDVVRRQMQVQALTASIDGGKAKGTKESLILIVQRQGWKQPFSGLSINYLKVVPSVGIGFTVYDAMKSRLRVPSRDEKVVEIVSEPRTTNASSLHPLDLDLLSSLAMANFFLID